MSELFLSLDDAVEIAVREFDADAVLARQEFMQKCYISNNQYEIGFFDGVSESLDAVRNLMDKHMEKEQEMTRGGALSDLNNLLNADDIPCYYKPSIKAVIDTITLEQEPKMGHWIEVTNGRGGHECNICHEYAPSYRSGDEYLTKYCPNCGCRMIEPHESEDKE